MATFAIYKTDKGDIDGGVFDLTLKEYHNLLPDNYEDIYAYDFKAAGNNYEEQKANVQAAAIDYSNAEKYDMDYGALLFVSDGFERLGRRYGLLTEFHNECIC